MSDNIKRPNLVERVKQLRNHPLVKAWIDQRKKENSWCENDADCPICTFPHSTHTICYESPFGALKLGHHYYSVTINNVEFFVSFVEELGKKKGFHWRNEIFFTKTAEGVEIFHLEDYNHCPQEKIWKIPQNVWNTIIEQMAKEQST